MLVGLFLFCDNGRFESEETTHIGHLTLQINLVTPSHWSPVWSAGWHLILQAACSKSANMVALVTLVPTPRWSWSHKCSVWSRSGLLVGRSILSTSKLWRSLINLRCGTSVVILEDSLVPDWRELRDCSWLKSFIWIYLSALRFPPMRMSLVFPVIIMSPQKLLLYQHSNHQSIPTVFSTLWSYDLSLVGRFWTHHWTRRSYTWPGSSECAADTSTNRPDDEGQSCQASISSCKRWLQICKPLHMVPECWKDEETNPSSWLISDIHCYTKLGIQFIVCQ